MEGIADKNRIERSDTVGDLLSDPTDWSTLTKKKVLGAGAYGEVLLMTRPGAGAGEVEQVAVKTLHAGALDLDSLTMFLNEVKLMKSFDHPNCVGFRGFGVKSGKKDQFGPSTPIQDLLKEEVFLVQEFLGGKDLRTVLADAMSVTYRPYDWLDVLRWFRGIADGLAYLHSRDPAIIHRDLKPENILFDVKDPRKARAVIADFGLSVNITSKEERDAQKGVRGKANSQFEGTASKTTDSGRSKPKSEASLKRIQTFAASYNAVHLTGETGSLLYMAPEVYRKEPYNEKSDVFAFGVMLYEALKQELQAAKFLSGSPQEIENYAKGVANGYRRPIPDNWPADVVTLIESCWDEDAPDRPSISRVVGYMAKLEEDGTLAAWETAHGRPAKSAPEGCCSIQ